MKIVSIDAFQIFDSRGSPTIEAVVTLSDGTSGHGLVPSGASTGRHEALELRDGDQQCFSGKSVYRAIGHVRGEIATALCGHNVFDQSGLDQKLIELDGTAAKARLGANAILAVSMATAQAAAKSSKQPLHAYLGEGRGNLLPLPTIQIVGGGKHAAGRIDVQDFMIIALSAQNYEEALQMTYGVFQAAGRLLKSRGLLAGVADEGGYWPVFDTNEAVLAFIIEAIEVAGYQPGKDVGLSLDIAATDLFHDGCYQFGLEKRRFTSEQFAALMIEWVDKYPVVSIEDPMAEDDWAGWQTVRNAIGNRCQLIGDDHFTTNLRRIERGIAANTANAVLIKLNQIGTVTETMAAIRATQAAGWLPVISARSGETEDAFIAHLAVATNAGQLKVGSFSRSERMAKWNEVLRIARNLGENARFEGAGIFARHGIVFPR
ncbi:MAG: phosphopyruvate hydratase [Opitutaceae bacterium]|nr:phosphopyruvate hydratase [Opitutaceae bacterium]